MGNAGASFRVCVGLWLGLWIGATHAEDWLPISAEDLAMRSEPLAPKAAAIYLYRQVDRDDDSSYVRVYNRIKILSDEGREQANIKIPFNKTGQAVRNIEARTIRPDGSIVEFTGKPYDQVIAKGQGLNTMAKLITLSDVQVGSVIEYQYQLQLDNRYVFDSNWVLNQDLFTKYAKYSLVPNRYFALRWAWPLGLPPGTKPPDKTKGKIQMEVRDVPAFVEEDHMPPESAVKMRVEFIYLSDELPTKDADSFWKKFGTLTFKQFDRYIGNPAALQSVVSGIVSADDTAEVKARKLYDWVQKLRNLAFERSKSEEERKREDIQSNRSVKDIIKHGYGWGDEINWLYVALARAAGLQADPVNVPSRSSVFFSPAMMDPNPLRTYVVRLKLNGTDLFVDPGTSYTPFGLIPWHETMVSGLLLNEKGGEWINTSAPKPAQGLIERQATLQLDETGTLGGKLKVIYHDLAALELRLDNRFDDAASRKETLENMVKGYVPVGMDVSLTNQPDWNSAERILTAEFDITVRGWMLATGNRAFLPATLFGAEEKQAFSYAARRHPIYFAYPSVTEDDVTIKLPQNLKVSGLPSPKNDAVYELAYSMKIEEQNGALRFQRRLWQPYVVLKAANYSMLHDFFQKVRTGDEQQLALVPASPVASSR